MSLILAAGSARPAEAASPSKPEILASQRHLADAGCYQGPVDGVRTAALDRAAEACPDQAPVLRIDIGMHVAPITRVATDLACTIMATSSDDKTVRLWSASDGQPRRTVRLPLGEGNGGKVYAVALSSDGGTLAAGGWDAAYGQKGSMGVYIVDLASGAVSRFDGFEDVVDAIAFSPDGLRVGVALHGGRGVRVIDRGTGREVMQDRDYDGDAYGLAFGSDGSLYATAWDGDLRRYGPGLNLVARVKAPGGARPYAVAVSPSGQRVAVGYDDAAAVSIFDAQTLRSIAEAEVADLGNAELSSVAWTGDGGTIVAGGVAGPSFAERRFFMRRFDPDGHRIGDDVAGNGDTVTDLKTCGPRVAFATADPSFGLLDAGGAPRVLQARAAADMRGKLGDALAVSADGTRVRFGLGFGGDQPALFDLAAGTLTPAPPTFPDLKTADVSTLPVTGWRDGPSSAINGRPLPLGPGEIAHSLAAESDGRGFALGTGLRLLSLDANGSERWAEPVPGTVWGLVIADEGKLVVTAYGDGTIRWHRWSDGRELLALFVDARDRRWVAWTPKGYYMASPGGEDLIGWHVNRGWQQEADFFPTSRFRDRFNRPDVVQAMLKTLDEGEAVRQADEAAHKRPTEVKPLIEHLPPVITILSPADGTRVSPGSVEIRYRVRLPSGGKLDRVEAFLDGAKIETRGLAPIAQADDPDGTGSLALPIPAHDATVSLVAYADGLASDAARVELKSSAPVASTTVDVDDSDALKPSLYALLVGVTHYANRGYDLEYAAADAVDLAAALKAQEGKLYRHVEIKVLTDQDATATGVKRGLNWLGRQTTARDLAVVFASGHGMTDAKGKFWFLTEDADPEDLIATAVSQDDLSSVLFDLPGKKLMLLDACHSGAALSAGIKGLQPIDTSSAVNDFAQAEGGVVAYAASTGREFSLERPEWGHGAFTKALIEGFGGKADLLHKGTVTTATLDAYLEDRVKELTGGLQHPVMTRPKTVPDFPIALLQ